jgi:hypothetical protein
MREIDSELRGAIFLDSEGFKDADMVRVMALEVAVGWRSVSTLR